MISRRGVTGPRASISLPWCRHGWRRIDSDERRNRGDGRGLTTDRPKLLYGSGFDAPSPPAQIVTVTYQAFPTREWGSADRHNSHSAGSSPAIEPGRAVADVGRDPRAHANQLSSRRMRAGPRVALRHCDNLVEWTWSQWGRRPGAPHPEGPGRPVRQRTRAQRLSTRTFRRRHTATAARTANSGLTCARELGRPPPDRGWHRPPSPGLCR